MAFGVGELQAAIWRTEEAISLQKERVASQVDPPLAEIARRSLETLEELLALQRRMLGFLIRLRA